MRDETFSALRVVTSLSLLENQDEFFTVCCQPFLDDGAPMLFHPRAPRITDTGFVM